MDSWFESHFRHAARIVHGFLAERMPLHGARLLDFGCGDGITGLGLTQLGVGAVVGVDINPSFRHLPGLAADNCGLEVLPENLSFVRVGADCALPFADASFDAAYSWSVFEHLRDVPAALAAIRRVLKPGGHCLIQIDPLYYSPFGSHLQRLVPTPWGHLLESAAAFVERARAADDGAGDVDKGDLLYARNDFDGYKKHLVEQFLDLNRLTARQLLYHAQASGLAVLAALPVRVPGEFVPPPQLACTYPADDLLTSTIYLVLRN
ncbi:class I SAM-dependent methyltransferase [Solidesulfovibrio sp.]|uniref:class I SAM-dependent methyltransferase n=1 Tax=Solidesulfovibrio sp. TaxID=2910990 RepID=UPI002604CD5B|nr:class I SAM-dependent methyltransferase [Solidesulfovibrio sp.]